MRQLLFTLANFFLLTMAYGQVPDPFDQTKLMVKNKVKSVKIFSCDSTEEYSCIKFVYDKKGNQIKETSCNNSEADTFIFQYDSLGNETVCKRNNGELYTEKINTYNKKGQLVKVVWKFIGEPKDFDRIETVYTFNNKDTLIKKQEKAYSLKGKVFFDETTSYYYNKFNRLKYIVFGADSLNSSKQYFFYNKNGLLRRDSTDYSAQTNRINKVILFQYDTNGYLVSWDIKDSKTGLVTKKKQTVDKNGLVGNKNEETCYEYEYFLPDK